MLGKTYHLSKVTSLSQKLEAMGAVSSELARYAFFVTMRLVVKTFYRCKLKKLDPWPEDAWKDVKLVILLNHTSLWEVLYLGLLPRSYLWHFARHGVFPAADVTMARPIVGRALGIFAPKVISISRKRDDSWLEFMKAFAKDDTLIFMPEGRMKRRNGLDKHGNAMTVKAGIVDVLLQCQHGRLLFAYSGGLHHVQRDKGPLPRVFKTLSMSMEASTIEAYLAQFSDCSDKKALTRELIADLEKRRDRYCPQ